VEVTDRHPRRDPPARDDATQRVLKVGTFSEQVWGGSDERRQARQARTLRAAGEPITALMSTYSASRATIYRVLAAAS